MYYHLVITISSLPVVTFYFIYLLIFNLGAGESGVAVQVPRPVVSPHQGKNSCFSLFLSCTTFLPVSTFHTLLWILKYVGLITVLSPMLKSLYFFCFMQVFMEIIMEEDKHDLLIEVPQQQVILFVLCMSLTVYILLTSLFSACVE